MAPTIHKEDNFSTTNLKWKVRALPASATPAQIALMRLVINF